MKNRTIYAVLVGIDDYPAPIVGLDGCVNDVKRMRDYLKGRYHKDEGFKLAPPTVLVNKKATKSAVIDAFRKQLGKAKRGDVALFYYSGHGSQELSPQEFWHLEPDKLDETLVCYDSRLPEHFDLADKELAFLIERVSKKGAHVVIILDSCHSGSGTRDVQAQTTRVRRVATDLRDRPLNTFIMSVEDATRLTRPAQPGIDSGWSAAGSHILLAACRDDEEAVEYHAIAPDGTVEPRGTFSYFLGEALRAISGPITYRELFARINAQIRSVVRGQSPQIESIPPGNVDGMVFDGAIRPVEPFYTLSYRSEAWRIDAGAVHGLPAAESDDPFLLDIFPFDAPTSDLREASKALVRVKVRKVEPTYSLVDAGAELDPSKPYKAVVAALPLPTIGVIFEPNDGEGSRLAREALATAGQGRSPSPYVREAGSGAPARFRLLAKDGGFAITSPENDRPLVAVINSLNSSTARMAISRLEHLAKWLLTSELSSSGTTIKPADVELVLIGEDGEKLPGPDIRLDYHLKDGKWLAPKFKIQLANKTKTSDSDGRDLYCGLLDLTDTFAINAILEAGCIRLGPNDGPYLAFQGKFVAATVPDKVWQQGVVEYKDVLKLIVATQEFDIQLMTQGALDLPSSRSLARGLRRRGSLNRLMSRMQTREIGVVPDDESLDDWYTTQITFTTVRPLEATRVPNSARQSVSLAGGVRLLSHPKLKASARLNPCANTSRDLGNLALPRLLRDDPAVSLAFGITAARGGDAGLSTLVLTEVEGETYTTVTPDEPLKLQVPPTLNDGEFVLPVGYDGEFFLPLGRAERTGQGGTELILERLPAPTSDGKKSLTGSIKIFFQKVVGPWVGKPSEYPILAVAKVGAGDAIEYIKDTESVRQLVAGANNILLYVHGIIGDTKEMASSALRGGFGSRYDLILTFDYENLDTPIPDNARKLGERLSDVGLAAGHAKALDVAAHSMGGLLSRWFIEREGGHAVVRRLVMLGTPNGGSPWPRLVDWATVALALGLNGLTGSPWPSRVLRGLTAALGDPRVALREMIPGSQTLKDLAKSSDPGIPYTMLAGDTSIIPSAAEKGGTASRLIGRLFGSSAMYAIANPFFSGAPNDLAVAIASMKKLPESWARKMRVVEAPCDHVTYFRSAAGLKALRGIIEK
jgi:hypothetical protein